MPQPVQALDLLQKPSTDAHQEADALLQQLGLTWRLSDAVWAACSAPSFSTLPPAEASVQQAVSSPISSISPAAKLLDTPVLFPPPNIPQAIQQHRHNLPPGGRQDPAGHLSESNPSHRPPSDAPSLLPASLILALQAAFDPQTSPYWTDHAYHDLDTPFFSYVHDLRQPPRCV